MKKKERKNEALNNSDVIEEKLEDLLGKYQSNLTLVCAEDILFNDMSRVITILGTFMLALQSMIDHWLWNEMSSTSPPIIFSHNIYNSYPSRPSMFVNYCLTLLSIFYVLITQMDKYSKSFVCSESFAQQ